MKIYILTYIFLILNIICFRHIIIVKTKTNLKFLWIAKTKYIIQKKRFKFKGKTNLIVYKQSLDSPR